MDNVKNDQYYVKKIMEFINFAISHLDSISCQEFESNDVLQNAIMFTFIQISENTNKLSDEFKQTIQIFHGIKFAVYGISLFIIMKSWMDISYMIQ